MGEGEADLFQESAEGGALMGFLCGGEFINRRLAIIEECDASKKRMMKMRYKVLCARYPTIQFASLN